MKFFKKTTVLLASLFLTIQESSAMDNEKKSIAPKLKIEIDFSRDQKNILTNKQKEVFQEASSFWQNYLFSALPNREHTIKIFADANFSDKEGEILGKAGPTHLYEGTKTIAIGEMTFDNVDIGTLEKNGTLKNVIIHEMGHVLGFGTMWEAFNVVSFGRPYAPVFTGNNAKKVYGDVMNTYPINVPVENRGGPGTYGSHWRESIFGNELMTGYINSESDRISTLTLAAFEDIGYKTNRPIMEYTLPSKESLRKLAEKPHVYGVREVLNIGRTTFEDFPTVPLN